MFPTFLLLILLSIGNGFTFLLDGHYSDIQQMLLVGANPSVQQEIRNILKDETLTRKERNTQISVIAQQNNLQEMFTWFQEKEREYEQLTEEIQNRISRDLMRAYRMIYKMSRCPRTSEEEKVDEVTNEVNSYPENVQSMLRSLFPSLRTVNIQQLREELDESLLEEIRNKNSAILAIASSYEKSYNSKKYQIDQIIKESNEKVAIVLRKIWTKIPGVHPLHLYSRKRRSYIKKLL